MTAEQFAYWLQGFTELNPQMTAPSPEQWKAISEHLQTVFKKVTPPVSPQVGPIVASPASDKTPKDFQDQILRDWMEKNKTPGMFPLPYPDGIQITC